MKLGILISGRGSNMEALVKACEEVSFPAEAAVVISNRPDALGLEIARSYGIPAVCVDHKDFESKAEFETAIDKELRAYNVEIVCLAGFMRIVSASFIEGWPDKILNIHPSLLPKYKGLDTHQRALDNNDVESGCTVHFVRPEMDSGPIILQKTVPILPDDTVNMLAERILEQEHKAYPEAVRLLAQDALKIVNEKVEIS